jgi:hypothetical protein
MGRNRNRNFMSLLQKPEMANLRPRKKVVQLAGVLVVTLSVAPNQR